MKTVMVTGASGFVGRHLCTLLRNEGHQVMTYSTRYGQDVRDYDQLRSYLAMAQPDEIHHLAAQAYVPETATNPARGYQVNVMGTLNLLEAVRQTGCRAPIHIAGTSEEYGYEHPPATKQIDEWTLPRPQTPYGASKLAAGTLGLVYAARYDMPVVVTRAFNHTGPGQSAQYAIPSFTRQVAQLRAGEIERIKVGNLNAVRDYSDVRDIVRYYRAAIGLESGIYNICSGQPRSMAEILRAALDVAGMDGTIEIGVDEGLYRPMTSQGSSDLPAPNCDKIHAATDARHQLDLETTLADMIAYWEAQQ